MKAHLESIAARNNGLTEAFEYASYLEAMANAVRTGAVHDQALAFETASEDLQQQFSLGTLPHREAVKAVADLGDLDPELVGLYGARSDKIVNAFEALIPDAPVIGLRGRSQSFVGIVTAPAQVTEIQIRKKSRSQLTHQPLMAPWGKVEVPLRTLDCEEKVVGVVASVEIGSLALATIGRTALQGIVQNSKFTLTTTNTSSYIVNVNNMHELGNLRNQIDTLHKLGMEPVDTSVLDREIARSKAYEARRFGTLRTKAKYGLGKR